MKEVVLVTGANGHVGFNVVKELLRRGYQVRAGVRDPADILKTAKLRALENVELVRAELLDPASLVNATKGVAGVFHVAAGYKLHSNDPQNEIYRPALDGTKNILEACAQNGVAKIIYTSSIATIGISRDGVRRSEENWNDEEHEFYAKAKTEAERLAWKIAAEKNLHLVSILPGAVIGPDFDRHTPTTYIFRKILLNQMPLKLDVAFPFIDVRDLAKAHVNAYELKEAKGRYIVCGPTVSIDRIFSVAKENFPAIRIPQHRAPSFLLPILPALDFLESKFTGSMRTLTKGVIAEYLSGGEQLLDNSRATRDLGFVARPIEETVVDTLAWINLHHIKW